jgi:hypothetical protein
LTTYDNLLEYEYRETPDGSQQEVHMIVKQVEWSKEEAVARKMSKSALEHSVIDCRKAELAMRGWNPEQEGYYSDLASVYSMELNRRHARNVARRKGGR